MSRRSSDNFVNGLRRPNSRILPAGENVDYVTARVHAVRRTGDVTAKRTGIIKVSYINAPAILHV